MFIMHAHRPQQTYFTFQNQSTSLEQVYPSDAPNVTTKALLNWATLAATSAHTLDFFNYQENLNNLKPFFTVVGYKKFLSSSAGLVDNIIKEKLILTAAAIGSAVIIWEDYAADGIYTWRIQVPLLLTYIGQGAKKEQFVISSLTVTKVPTNLAATGIGITQMIDGEAYAGL